MGAHAATHLVSRGTPVGHPLERYVDAPTPGKVGPRQLQDGLTVAP